MGKATGIVKQKDSLLSLTVIFFTLNTLSLDFVFEEFNFNYTRK